MAETGRRFTIEDILGALRASTEHAYIEEQERSCYVIDGHFNLEVVAEMLSQTPDKRPF